MDEDDNLPTHTVEVNVDKRRKSLPGTAATPGTVGGQNNKREWWNIRCYCLIVIVVACYSFYFFKFVLLHCNSHGFPLLHFPSVLLFFLFLLSFVHSISPPLFTSPLLSLSHHIFFSFLHLHSYSSPLLSSLFFSPLLFSPYHTHSGCIR